MGSREGARMGDKLDSNTPEYLPRATVKRIVKTKMLDIAATRFRDERTSRDLPIHRDAVVAFTESARIFIHYLSATASDICLESKRQMMSTDDVLKAVEEIEFVELMDPLRSFLEGYRKANESKKAEKKGTRKKNSEKSRGESHEDENSEVDNEDNGDDQEESSNMEEEDDK